MEYPWKTERRFNSFTGYLQKKFGGRVQKLSLDAGFTCPNRDGTLGIGGCIFCDNKAFSPSYVSKGMSITEQLKAGAAFHAVRYKTDKFFAYFQTFSNTYAPLEKLKEVYEEALAFDNIVGLIINTRPDCIDEEKLDYLAELSQRTYVMVEYGIESCFDKTLKLVNRGHTYETAQTAVELTHAKGLPVGAHFIFGLPSERSEDMLNMVHIINKLPLDNVKFHQMQVVSGTKLELLYRLYPKQLSPFPTFDSYVSFIIPFIEQLRPDIKIQRIAGEINQNMIVFPKWGDMRYEQMLTAIEKELEKKKTWQGRLYKGT